MFKYYAFILLPLLLSVVKTQAQSDSKLDSLIDNILFEDEEMTDILLSLDKTYHFVYFNSDWSNKAFFMGREIGEDQYNFTGQISYFNSKGIYGGVSGSYYSQLDPKYGSTIVSLGYSKTLKNHKGLSLRTSYSRYIYHIPDEDFKADFSNSARFGVTLKNRKVGSRMDFSFLFGNDFTTNVSWSLYTKIVLHKFDRFNKIQIVPRLSTFFGQEDVQNEIRLRFFSTTETETKFGLMNTQINLPLMTSYKSFDLELGYTYNLPRSLDEEYEYSNTSSFNISIGYILDF